MQLHDTGISLTEISYENKLAKPKSRPMTNSCLVYLSHNKCKIDLLAKE